MANGDNNNSLDQQINYNIDEELARIDQMIADMHAAEQKAAKQGLLPGQYNLSAMTQEERQRRIDEVRFKEAEARRGGGTFEVDYTKSKEENTRAYAQWLADTMTGDYTTQDVLGQARTKMEEMYDPEYAKKMQESQREADIRSGRNRKFESYLNEKTDERRYILDTPNVEGIFDIGGEEYKLLDYTDQAANKVLIDENGKMMENSPVIVLGTDQNNKPILAAKKGYNATGVKPMTQTLAKETLTPNAQMRELEYKLTTDIQFQDDPDKWRKLFNNRENPVYNSIEDITDQNAVDFVKKFQDTGLLREKPREPVEPVPVQWENKEEKQKWLEKYEQKQQMIQNKLSSNQ